MVKTDALLTSDLQRTINGGYTIFEYFVQSVRGIHQTDGFIPLHEPRFLDNEKRYLNDVIDSTFVSSVGSYVGEFETVRFSTSGHNAVQPGS